MWTGAGEATRQLFPALDTLTPADRPNENMCSLGFRLTYGQFRYFTGGDLPGTPDPGFPAWHGVEAAIASVIGRVDAHVVNQHGSMGEESEPFLQWLQSTVLIVPSPTFAAKIGKSGFEGVNHDEQAGLSYMKEVLASSAPVQTP